MRAVIFSEYGGPEVLRVVELDEPHPGPGRVRIAVKAVGVNMFDAKLRSGMMDGQVPVTFPKVTAGDAAGVVDEVGEGADAAVGDEVFGFAVGGAAAESAVLDNWAPKPASLSWEEAAGLPLAVETAVRALDAVGLSDGETLVINGAAGGVGTAATQFALGRGATVIGTASESNHAYLRSLGAEVTTYGDGLVDRVRALAPDGVDRTFDTAGKGAIPALLELVGGDPERVVTIADFTDGPRLGVKVTTGSEGRSNHALPEAAALVDAGRFRLPVEQTFSFDDAADAHRLSEGGHVRGKVVLVP